MKRVVQISISCLIVAKSTSTKKVVDTALNNEIGPTNHNHKSNGNSGDDLFSLEEDVMIIDTAYPQKSDEIVPSLEEQF